MSIVAEPVGHDQLDHLATFLRSEELPDDDISLPNRHFFFFKDEDGQFLGIGGFEIHGSDALLRSVVTAPDVRGQGHGVPMGEAVLNVMRGHGAVIAGTTLREAVLTAVYLQVNANIPSQAMGFGESKPLSPGEVARTSTSSLSPYALDPA